MILRFAVNSPRSDSPLREVWSQDYEDNIVDALRTLRIDNPERDRELLSSQVFDVLQETTSQRIRNAAALTLVDLGVDTTTLRIVDVLRRADLAKVSGTLLFALNEIDASIPLGILLDIVESGSFEARNQAMFFLQENRFIVEPGFIETAMTRLSKMMESKDEEQAEAAEFAKHYFFDSEFRSAHEVTA